MIVALSLMNTAEIAQFKLSSNTTNQTTYIIDVQSRLDLQTQFVNKSLLPSYTIDTRQNTSDFIQDNQLVECQGNIYYNCYVYINQTTDQSNWNNIQQRITEIKNQLGNDYNIIYTSNQVEQTYILEKNVFASGMLATALLFGIIILVYLGVSWWPNAITEDPIEMPKKAIE